MICSSPFHFSHGLEHMDEEKRYDTNKIRQKRNILVSQWKANYHWRNL